MAETHGVRIIVGCIAAGAIAPGHAVELASNSGGEKTVNQADSANEAWGVYIGDVAAAQYDHVEICIFGLCKAWVDGAITVNPPQPLSNDTDGHIVAETADKKRAIGFAAETNGATENMGEIFVNPHYTSL
jgi:hypothetical protein